MKALVHLLIALAIVACLCLNWGCSWYSSLSAHKLAVETELRIQPQGPAPDLDSSKPAPPATATTHAAISSSSAR